MTGNLQTLGFAPSYSVEPDPEFPGDGDWGVPLHGFASDGSAIDPYRSVSGTPVVLRIDATGGSPWVGMFESGGIGGASAVVACPGPDDLCVVVDGLAYLVDVTNPVAGAVVAHGQVWQVVGVARPALLLLVGATDMVAVGAGGIAWRTPRLALDGLRVDGGSATGIVCTADHPEGPVTIEIDPTTGAQTSGPQLDVG